MKEKEMCLTANETMLFQEVTIKHQFSFLLLKIWFPLFFIRINLQAIWSFVTKNAFVLIFIIIGFLMVSTVDILNSLFLKQPFIVEIIHHRNQNLSLPNYD
jgi:hypothetical protein